MKIIKAVLKTLVVISNQVKEAKLVVGPQHHIGAMDLGHGGWLRVDPHPPDPKWPPVLIPPVNILIVTPDPEAWEEKERIRARDLRDSGLPPDWQPPALDRRGYDEPPDPGLPMPGILTEPSEDPRPDHLTVADRLPSEPPPVIVPPDPPTELGGALGAPPAGGGDTPATDLRGAALEQFRAKATGGSERAPPAPEPQPATAIKSSPRAKRKAKAAARRTPKRRR